MFNLIRTGVLIAALTGLFMAVGYLLGGQAGMLIALAVAAMTNLFAYWNSDRMVLAMQGAVPVEPSRAPDLHRMVETLAARAGIPMPRLYVIETAQPNAFATGRNPANAAVAVSSGLLNTLGADEVAGVLAHEIAHIRNRDTLTMTVTATLAGAISMLAQFGLFFGGGNNRDNPLGGIGALLTVLLAPLAAAMVQMAVSRTREYEADRDGARISGEPLALASALAKISRGARQTVNVAAERNPAMAHLYIANPLSGARLDSLFSTHPAVENRIAALEQMAAEMGQNASSGAAPAFTPGDGPGRDWRVPQFSAGDERRRRGPWG